MNTAEQQAGATEREAVERIAAWIDPKFRGEAWPFWNPFTDAIDERELLTAVQERWGRPAVERHNLTAHRRWGAYLLALRTTICLRAPEPVWRNAGSNADLLAHAYIAPGDIARAVDAVLREHPE